MQQTANDDEQLMTVKDVQEFLKVSRSSIYRLIEEGTLVGHKVLDTWRFYRRDVKACLIRKSK